MPLVPGGTYVMPEEIRAALRYRPLVVADLKLSRKLKRLDDARDAVRRLRKLRGWEKALRAQK